MSLSAKRILRTESSERFVLRKPAGEEFAALEVHYLANGSVAATLILFENAGVKDEEIPALLAQIDDDLLPEASVAEGNLSFTVVTGRVVGSFLPDRDDSAKRS